MACHVGTFAELADQLLSYALIKRATCVGLEAVVRFTRQDAHAFLVSQRLDKRHAVDRIRIHKRRACQVNQRRNLVRSLNGSRFVFEGTKGLQPSEGAAEQQDCQQEKSAPEEVDAELQACTATLRQPFEGAR